jgi:hypothetical protein
MVAHLRLSRNPKCEIRNPMQPAEMRISKNITSVSSAAKDTTNGANHTLSAATELSKLAADLKGVVDLART